MNNTILVLAKEMIEVIAPDCIGLSIPEEHMYIVTGDYGFMFSSLTRKEALEFANMEAEEMGDIVQIEE
jgi:hypothetical protein